MNDKDLVNQREFYELTTVVKAMEKAGISIKEWNVLKFIQEKGINDRNKVYAHFMAEDRRKKKRLSK